MGIDNPQPGGQKLQDKAQATPSNPPNKTADVPGDTSEEPKLYTEKDLQAKLSEQRSQDRKGFEKERKALEAKTNDMAAELASLQEKDLDVEVLKKTIANLHGEIEEGLPDDAKEAANKYLKKLANLTESETKGMKGIKKMSDELGQYKKEALKPVAEKLAADNGVDVEDLMKLPDRNAMIVYAYENRNPEKIVKGEAKQEVTADAKQGEVSKVTQESGTDKAPRPDVANVTSGTSDSALWKRAAQPGYKPTPAEMKQLQTIYNNAMKGG